MHYKMIAPLLAGIALATGAGSFATAAAMAEKTVQVGGAPMYPSKNIVQNAVNSKDHTTLVAAVKAAGLVDTLSSPGPFTVFAPTNAAFAKLPAGTVESLVKPENKGTLTTVLTYHVVAGRMSASDIAAKIKAGGGKAMLKTASGGMLTATLRGDHVLVMDAKGNAAMVIFDMPPLASVSQMAPFFWVTVRSSPSAVFSIALPPPALILAERSAVENRPGTT